MFEPPVQRLIDELSRLPGVGQKSAQRIAFHLLNVEEADANRLADAISEMRSYVRICQRCYNVTAEEECSICTDMRRDTTLICVVERAQDIPVLERTQIFKGRYHVLGHRDIWLHLSPSIEHSCWPQFRHRLHLLCRLAFDDWLRFPTNLS